MFQNRNIKEKCKAEPFDIKYRPNQYDWSFFDAIRVTQIFQLYCWNGTFNSTVARRVFPMV